MSLILNYDRPINTKHPLNEGLVSRWKYLPNLSGGGDKLYDIVYGWKKPNHGTLTNGPTWGGSLGLPGSYGCLNFNGTNQRGSVSNFVVGANNITIGCWAWSTTFTYAGKMLVNSQPTNSSYSLRLESSKVRFNGGNSSSVVEFSPPSGNQWHHICGTLDGTSAAIYLDGIQQATGTITGFTDSARTLDFAAYSDFGAGYFFPGNLDNIVIYNRALSQSEVYQLVASQKRTDDPTLNWINTRSYFVAGGNPVVVFPPPQVILQGQTFNVLQAAGGVLLANR